MRAFNPYARVLFSSKNDENSKTLDFMCRAVTFSVTRWGESDFFPHVPFALDDVGSNSTSVYETDLVIEGIRYTYGFESMRDGIQSEWLYSYPARKRRMLFERTVRAEIKFGRGLHGENTRIAKLLRPTALYLSLAANRLTNCGRHCSDWGEDGQSAPTEGQARSSPKKGH